MNYYWIKYLLAFLFLLIRVNISFAQKGEKDTLLIQVNKRLAVITSMIDDNKKMNTDSILKLNHLINLYTGEITRLKNEALNNKLKTDGLESKIKDLGEESNKIKRSEQIYIDQMIKSIIQESYKINPQLVYSVYNLAQLKGSILFPEMVHFVKAYDMINAAHQYLSRPYDADSVNFYITKFRDFSWKIYSIRTLETEKENAKALLEFYCSSHNFIVKEITDTKNMLANDRAKVLEPKKYRVVGYPYLLSLLDLAINNKDFSLAKAICPPKK